MRKMVDDVLSGPVPGTVSDAPAYPIAAHALNFVRGISSALALKSKRGVTAIEYGLIAALIAVAIITAVTLVGTNLQLTFNTIAGHLGSSPH